MKNVGIIGGGIIGLCSAYYLNKSGHRVTIIDQGDLKLGLGEDAQDIGNNRTFEGVGKRRQRCFGQADAFGDG